MDFFDIIGQQGLVSSLRQIIESDRIAFAYLFVGSEGMGKRTIGGMFAKAILCTSNLRKPCGKCLSCRQCLSGNHPDLAVVKPQKTSIGIEEIRTIQKGLSIRPYQSDRKIILIEDAHLLTFQAQNALLKSLEEPPAFVVFILLSQRLQGLLPTVLSRLKVFRLERLSRKDIAGIIIRRTDTKPEKADLYAALAEGNPGKGLKLSVSSEFSIQREGVFGFLRNISADFSELLSFESFFADNRDNVEAIFDLLISWFRDCLVFKETKDLDLIINIDMKDLLETHAEALSGMNALYTIEMIEKSKKMIKGNANFQLVVENVLFEIFGRFKYGGYRGAV
jgi:DNA polymerase-3 subunit delta'